MIETIKGLQGDYQVLNFSLNEALSPSASEFNHFIKLENFRVSKDGERLEKRDGLTLQATIAGGYPIYGYLTYYNATPAFCELAVTSKAIWRKVGAGAWTSIYSWASPYLSHPVKPFQAQGRVYVMTELANVLILEDGTVTQVGIDAPTGSFTVTPTYAETLFSDDLDDLTSWTEADVVSPGASSLVDLGDDSVMELTTNPSPPGTSGSVSRYTDIGGLGDNFVLDVYFKVIYFTPSSESDDEDYVEFTIANNNHLFSFRIKDSLKLYVKNGDVWADTLYSIKKTRVGAKWQGDWVNAKFLIDKDEYGNFYCEIFCDTESVGQFYCGEANTDHPGRVRVHATSDDVATRNVIYVSSVIVANTTGGKLIGLRRFAVSYLRDGDYPSESKALKSNIGTPAFTGSGLDDLTVSGEYTAGIGLTIRVQIDGEGTPDTFKWSQDGGSTWSQEYLQAGESVAIPFGIILEWAASAGHTSGDYWDIECKAFSACFTLQKAILTGIPVSADPQVTKKRIYMTTSWGATFFKIGEIDNAQTSFYYNLTDEALGVQLEDDREPPELGKVACFWDNRTWVMVEDDQIVYYSDITKLDEFSVADRWVSLQTADHHDKPTMLMPYNGSLYCFKQASVIKITPYSAGGYTRTELPLGGVGAVAGWSVQEVGGLLTFLSDRGLEAFDGEKLVGHQAFNGESLYGKHLFSPVSATVETWDRAYPDGICSCHHEQRNELLVSFPNRTGGASAITVAANYLTGKFTTFTFPYTPSLLVRARDSSGQMRTYMGTSAGLVLAFDVGSTDNGTNITAEARLNWIRDAFARNWRYCEVEYEIPDGYALMANFYANFQSTVRRTESLAGNTPTGSDADLRKVVRREIELAIVAQYIGVGFANAEAVGSDLKINFFLLLSGTKERKNDIEGD
jgi:hypothetical protein